MLNLYSIFSLLCCALALNIHIYLFLTALGLRCCAQVSSSCNDQGLLFNCSVQASHCGGLSCCRSQALDVWASVAAARRLRSLVHGFSCPTICGIFPEKGLNLSLALAGRFLTYDPPGKSLLSPSFGALGGGMSTSDLGLCVCILLSVMCGSRAILVVDLLDLTSESSE